MLLIRNKHLHRKTQSFFFAYTLNLQPESAFIGVGYRFYRENEKCALFYSVAERTILAHSNMIVLLQINEFTLV